MIRTRHASAAISPVNISCGEGAALDAFVQRAWLGGQADADRAAIELYAALEPRVSAILGGFDDAVPCLVATRMVAMIRDAFGPCPPTERQPEPRDTAPHTLPHIQRSPAGGDPPAGD